ncbi:hypothetical protein [Micromonospora chersina]
MHGWNEDRGARDRRRHRRVLSAVLELMTEQGLTAVTMDAAAARAG